MTLREVRVDRRSLLFSGVLAGGLAACGYAAAHHSFAMFDRNKEVLLTGEIAQVQWANPHVWIHVKVKKADGTFQDWPLEGGSPNLLSRNGWKRTSLTVGEPVTVLIYPMKDGSASGSFIEFTKKDGSKLNYHG